MCHLLCPVSCASRTLLAALYPMCKSMRYLLVPLSMGFGCLSLWSVAAKPINKMHNSCSPRAILLLAWAGFIGQGRPYTHYSLAFYPVGASSQCLLDSSGRASFGPHSTPCTPLSQVPSPLLSWVAEGVTSSPLCPGIFGQRLEDTVHHERKYGPRLAPLLVEQCVDFIRERGLTEEGLFRMPGQANLVRDLQDSFDCGEKPLFDR